MKRFSSALWFTFAGISLIFAVVDAFRGEWNWFITHLLLASLNAYIGLEEK